MWTRAVGAKDAAVFADVGANVGSYTILASAAIGVHVLAFEPDDEAFTWLLRNIELNRVCGHVQARREAVGANIGVAPFTPAWIRSTVSM